MSTVDEMLQQALRLESGDRAELAHRLIDSLDEGASDLSRAEWEAAWADEIRRRIEQIDQGEAKLLDRDEFEGLIREAIARRRVADEAAVR